MLRNQLMVENIGVLFPCLLAIEVITSFSNKLGTEWCMSSSSQV